VLDEEEYLPETLLAARAIGIDAAFIGDTGCTDESEAVTRQVLDGIPLTWHKIMFESIGQARSEILRHAHGKAEWLLMLDADMTVQGALPPEPRTADCYHGTVLGSWEYQLPLLVRGSRRWAYHGVAHSYLVAEDGDGNYSEGTCDLRIIDRRPGGWRPGKLEEDARLLEKELEKNPEDARSSFYLAQTYDDLGRTGDALREYGRRSLLQGWDQERFVAKLRRARLLCKRDKHAGLGALLEAWHDRPARAEPLYSAARHCRQEGWDQAALLFARTAASIPKPADRLFVEASVYETWVKMELGIAELRAGDRKKGNRILRDLRKNAGLSDANKAWIDELLAE
jgi:tetratricopeptide (TPR) repeat protein